MGLLPKHGQLGRSLLPLFVHSERLQFTSEHAPFAWQALCHRIELKPADLTVS
jgi:hypothetical protein